MGCSRVVVTASLLILSVTAVTASRNKQVVVEYDNGDIGRYNETVILRGKVVQRNNHFSGCIEDFKKKRSAVIYNSANNTCILLPTLVTLKHEREVVKTGLDPGPYRQVSLQADSYAKRTRNLRKILGKNIMKFCKGKKLLLTHFEEVKKNVEDTYVGEDTIIRKENSRGFLPPRTRILFGVILSGSVTGTLTVTSNIDIDINIGSSSGSTGTSTTNTNTNTNTNNNNNNNNNNNGGSGSSSSSGNNNNNNNNNNNG
ncbi:myb-like protein W [Penaeus chinensis]|uniref:myb-like protein W n=1 Tax=Penaeus chinensis TaxID=139456 RepID=UPI001FB691F9|nr:myb-like protein W [Penaeus chinensis]